MYQSIGIGLHAAFNLCLNFTWMAKLTLVKLDCATHGTFLSQIPSDIPQINLLVMHDTQSTNDIIATYYMYKTMNCLYTIEFH